MIIIGSTTNTLGKTTSITLKNGQKFEPVVDKLCAYTFAEDDDTTGVVYFKHEVFNVYSANMITIDPTLEGGHLLTSTPIVVSKAEGIRFVSDNVVYTRDPDSDILI